MNTLIVSCQACKTKNRIQAGKQHLSPKCGKCGHSIELGSSAIPVELSDPEFQSFVKTADLPLMVDFYSPTCGPCKAIAPLIKTMSEEYLGEVIVAKINTSDNPGTAMHYKIRGVPSLLFFKNGELIDQIVGAPPEPQLRHKLNAIR